MSFRPTPAEAGGEPESRNFKDFWMPAFAGMTVMVVTKFFHVLWFQDTND